MAYLEYAFNTESTKRRTEYVKTMNSPKKNTITGYIRILRQLRVKTPLKNHENKPFIGGDRRN